MNPAEKLDFPNSTMIMEYIEGKDINGEDFKKPEVRKALVKALQDFHASRVKFANIYDVFRDAFTVFLNISLDKISWK